MTKLIAEYGINTASIISLSYAVITLYKRVNVLEDYIRTEFTAIVDKNNKILNKVRCKINDFN